MLSRPIFHSARLELCFVKRKHVKDRAKELNKHISLSLDCDVKVKQNVLKYNTVSWKVAANKFYLYFGETNGGDKLRRERQESIYVKQTTNK